MKKNNKKTILLIEDDLPTVEIYQMALEKTGNFKVEVITFGDEAMARIKEINEGRAKRPDFILLNLKMPGANGEEILREIRKNENTRDLKLFITSNYPWRTLEDLGYDVELLGKETYILKSDYNPSQIVKLVKERLGEK